MLLRAFAFALLMIAAAGCLGSSPGASTSPSYDGSSRPAENVTKTQFEGAFASAGAAGEAATITRVTLMDHRPNNFARVVIDLDTGALASAGPVNRYHIGVEAGGRVVNDSRTPDASGHYVLSLNATQFRQGPLILNIAPDGSAGAVTATQRWVAIVTTTTMDG